MNAPIDKWEMNDTRTSVPRPRWANDEEWRAAETVPFVPSLPLDDKESQNLDRLAAELAASAAEQFKSSVTPAAPKPDRIEAPRTTASEATRIFEPRGEARTETRADARDAIPVWMQRPHALQPAVAATTTLPPIHETSRFRLGYAARAFALSVAAAGGVLLAVYGVPAPLRQLIDDSFTDSTASEPARSAAKTGKLAGVRLVAGDIRGAVGEWVPLNMAVEGAMPEGDAIITGFAPGTTLSMGEAYGANAWRVAIGDLPKLQAHLPQNYSGNMDLVVELRRGDAMVIDRRNVRFEAANPKLALASMGRPQQPAPVQGVGPSSGSVPARGEETVVAALPRNAAPPAAEEPAAAPARQIDPAEVAVLVKRGEELVKTGDLAGARLLLQRAADARHAGATFALATTYDPIMLKQLPVLGVNGDVGLARQWYERARDLGIREATVRLEALARWGR